MATYGVRVPPGIACKTPDEVAAAAAKLGGDSGEVVVKSQVRRPPRASVFKKGYLVRRPSTPRRGNLTPAPLFTRARCSPAVAVSGRSRAA
jgi:hypothetical protein